MQNHAQQPPYLVSDSEPSEKEELADELVEMLRGERGRHRGRDLREGDVGRVRGGREGGAGGEVRCQVDRGLEHST